MKLIDDNKVLRKYFETEKVKPKFSYILKLVSKQFILMPEQKT